MARNQEPMTDEEIEAFEEVMDEQGENFREALADDLGGDADDYRAGQTAVTDGGED